MKLTPIPPKPSSYNHLIDRVESIWKAHPECIVTIGDTAGAMGVLDGSCCMVTHASGSVMSIRYVRRENTQFMFDAYGT